MGKVEGLRVGKRVRDGNKGVGLEVGERKKA